MALLIENYLGKRRTAQLERSLLRELMEVPEEERFQFIQQVLSADIRLGLRLANVSLRKREYFRWMLDRALITADASRIKLWLGCVIPRLGMSQVVSILTERMPDQPEAVRKAAYWLPKFSRKEDIRGLTALHKFLATLAIGTQKPGEPRTD